MKPSPQTKSFTRRVPAAHAEGTLRLGLGRDGVDSGRGRLGASEGTLVRGLRGDGRGRLAYSEATAKSVVERKKGTRGPRNATAPAARLARMLSVDD